MVFLGPILIPAAAISLFSSSFTSAVAVGQPPDSPQLIFSNDAATWHTASTQPVKNLEDWIDLERSLAFRYLLDNIAPNGTNTEGSSDGTVIASPSKAYPNYFYQWVRDAAITIQGVIHEYGKSGDLALMDIVDGYANLQREIQGTSNPSGGFATGGLGEPKFMVDGTPFTGYIHFTLLGLYFMKFLIILNE